MVKSDSVKEVGKKVAQNFGRAEIGRVKDQVDETTEGFKIEAAGRIEDLAQHIRGLGDTLHSEREAGKIARRLEKTADYVRYRKTSDIGKDTVSMIRESKAFWLAAGLLVGMIIYKSARLKSERESSE